MDLAVIAYRHEIKYIKALEHSFFTYHSGNKIYLLTIDCQFQSQNQNIISLNIFDLPLGQIVDYIFNLKENFQPSIFYSQAKLILRPFFIDFLFKNFKVTKLMIVEPLTYFYNSLKHLDEILDIYSLLVFPYFLDFKNYDQYSQFSFLDWRFIALKNNSLSKEFIDWWQEKTKLFLENKLDKDYFIFQKFFDQIPYIFNQVYIVKEPGMNVNFFNLKERKISYEGKYWFVNRKPLYFFTFSFQENFAQYNGLAKILLDDYLVLINHSNFEKQTLVFTQPQEALHQTNFWFKSFQNENFYRKFQKIYDKLYLISWTRPLILKLKEPIKKILYLLFLITRKKSINFQYSSSFQKATKEVSFKIIGFLGSEKGLGEAARCHLRVFDFLKLNYQPIILHDYYARNIEKKKIQEKKKVKLSGNIVSLFAINPDWTDFFYKIYKNLWKESKYKIGSWVWESEIFPQEFQKYFSLYDEIWVPSNFLLKNLSLISPLPVVLIPHSLAAEYPLATYSLKKKLGFSDKSFIFFFMFDFCSYLERKNPLDLIKVFINCHFPPHVYLLIKTMNKNIDPRGYKLLKNLARGHKNIIIIDKIFKREEINTLLSEINCYVSLHRAEGFGLTLLEAMNFGKPVIATRYSGNLDFMNDQNSFLVDYVLVENPRNFGPYKKGLVWAQPDLKQAEYFLRYVYENYQEALSKASVGQKFVKDNFSIEKVSQLYRKRLNFILERLEE